MKKSIKVLSISDVHLYHPRTPTKFIIRNLIDYFDGFSDVSRFKDLDILLIAGDLFDRLLNAECDEFHDVIEFGYRLLKFCGRNKIRLRILEGTPSHDRNQSKILESIQNGLDIPSNFAYIPQLHIEFIEDLKLHILYVPDEWKPTPEETEKDVDRLLAEHNLDQVDIAVMHGMFSYQCPNAPAKIPRHREDFYLARVKKHIFIGHVHNPSTYDRIIAQGSFDRTAHGEEEKKGGFLVEYRDGYPDHVQFIENKNAKKYVTVDLTSEDIDRSMSKLEQYYHKLPVDSYLRIRCKKSHPMYIGLEDLRLKFPNVILSRIASDQVNPDDYLLIHQHEHRPADYNPITITPENIVGLMMREIDNKSSLPINRRTEMVQLLDSLL